jgi:hypothetical protein
VAQGGDVYFVLPGGIENGRAGSEGKRLTVKNNIWHVSCDEPMLRGFVLG